MKIRPEARSRKPEAGDQSGHQPSAFSLQPLLRGFTMVEIAISLAVIGVALVAIIGVLPLGMRVQRDNREQTVINQDATVFMEAIRNGARGLDDLTNYVFLITNTVTTYNNLGQPVGAPAYYGYTYAGSTLNGAPMPTPFPITSGQRIVGLLSTPEFTDLSFNPTNNLFSGGYSNHVIAYVRSLSGPAVEKPPQANDSLVREDSFSYRMLCVNAPLAVDVNMLNSAYQMNLQANLHELRLAFLWPQLPNGGLGLGRQTYRTTVAGQVTQTNYSGQRIYFYQPQSFVTNAP